MVPVETAPRFVEGSAQGKDIERGGSQAIGGHVAFGAGEFDRGAGFADGAVVREDPGATEEQDIGGFDVAVDEAGGMRFLE